MKKLIICILALTTCAAVFSQQKAKPKTAGTSVATTPVLKSRMDSLNYALGLSLAQFYKEQGLKTINTTLVSRAINDAMKGGKILLTQQQMNECIGDFVEHKKSEKSSVNKKAGLAFLAANKSKPGVVTLASGLQYQVLKEGNGPKPGINDTVRCHYAGTLTDGTPFDSSIERGQPAEFPVGGVISGWIEALQLMPVGSKWRLFIPSDLAYGDNQAGPTITPGSTLIFEVELLEIVKK
jgi:FKBP-type peptidyl-prolyl cis-trans isomerase FklB